jgi:hypothetical protein
MKKQEAIQKVKEGTHAIEMNRKDPKDIKLLRDILKEAFPNDDDFASGKSTFYFKMDGYKEWNYDYETTLPTIKITEIEQEETFESGELVEVSYDKDVWYKRYFIGVSIQEKYTAETEEGVVRNWNYIRKINPEIEQIREIMKKNNISKEDL